MAHIKVEAGDADEPVDLLDPENGVLSRFIDYLYKQGNRGIQSARDLADVLDDFMSPEPPEELIKVVDAAEVINRGPRMYGLLEGVETLSLEPRRGFDDGF